MTTGTGPCGIGYRGAGLAFVVFEQNLREAAGLGFSAPVALSFRCSPTGGGQRDCRVRARGLSKFRRLLSQRMAHTGQKSDSTLDPHTGARVKPPTVRNRRPTGDYTSERFRACPHGAGFGCRCDTAYRRDHPVKRFDVLPAVNDRDSFCAAARRLGGFLFRWGSLPSRREG